MSYKPVFIFVNNERCTNGQAFASYQEASLSAAARFQRWTMPTDWDVEESSEPVNYRHENGQDISIPTQVEVVPGLVVVGDHADKIAAKLRNILDENNQ